MTHETEPIPRIYEKDAPKYHRQMRAFDRMLLAAGGGRDGSARRH